MVLHHHTDSLAPRLFGKRFRAVAPSQQFRPDMDVHVDDALIVDARKRRVACHCCLLLEIALFDLTQEKHTRMCHEREVTLTASASAGLMARVQFDK